MFAGSYFAPRYFARVYFPGANPLKVRYFPHNIFAQRFFPDRYFPGNTFVSVVEPPIPTPIVTTGGGGPVRGFIPPIRAIADLILPLPVVDGYGYLTPAQIRARLEAQLISLEVDLGWQTLADPIPIGVRGEWTVPSLTFSVSGTRTRTPPSSGDEEMDLLLEHYMRTLHDLTMKGRK